jgi:phenylacetate-CoA ligase
MESLMEELALGTARPGVLDHDAELLERLWLRAWRDSSEAMSVLEIAADRERWSPQRLRAWQQERLAYTLDQAATHVPWYRAQWQRRRQRGDAASWHYIENWPVLEKSSVRSQANAFTAENRPGRLNRHRTSGTSGSQLDLWWRPATVRGLYALTARRTLHWHDLRLGNPGAVVTGHPTLPMRQQPGVCWYWDGALNRLTVSTSRLTAERARACVDALARHRVSYVWGHTAQVLALAHHVLAAGGSDLQMKAVFATGEPLTGDARHAITRAFGCPVRDRYCMSEMVAAASECTAGRMHLWPEIGWIEVHRHGSPAPAGVAGEFVCTGVINADMPLIRYRVGDRGRLAADTAVCACGRTLPRLDAILGRVSEPLPCADDELPVAAAAVTRGHGHAVECEPL